MVTSVITQAKINANVNYDLITIRILVYNGVLQISKS